MAKISSVEKNKRRERTVAKFAEKRKALKAIIQSGKSSPTDRMTALFQLQQLPRDASPTRLHNRCQMTGRARGYLRRFGLSRIAFRELALNGEIPGVRKASW
jgi:small subunit ribosomal protein S14